MLLSHASRSALSMRGAFRSRLLPRTRPVMTRSRPVVCATGTTLDVKAKEAYEIMSTGARVLDVRTKQEFLAGRVEGAVNVPVFNMAPLGMTPNPDFLDTVLENFPDKSEQIVVHCKSGVRSRAAADILLQADYTNLVHMDGGFMDWVGSGLPVQQ